MIKKFLNSRGMSLMEIVIAVGLIGVLSLGTMKLLETTNRGMKNFEKSSEVLSLESSISSYLLSSGGCKQLLGLATGSQVEIRSAIKELNPVTNVMETKFGKTIYNAGKEFGKVKILSLVTLPLVALDNTSEAGILPVELEIIARDNAHEFSGKSKTFKRQIMVPVGLEAGAVVDCNLDRAAMYEIIMERICQNTFGSDFVGMSCAQAIIEVEKRIKASICNDITGEPGNFNLSTEFCDIHKAHSTESCPGANEYAYGFSTSGAILCR